jgi:hypothetical protein
MWKSAQLCRPEPWEGKAACRGCPAGARRAGLQVAPTSDAVDHLRRVCSRCQQPSLRLVHGLHCVSCFNRHREAVKGRNRKGTVPRLCAILHAREVAVAHGDAVSVRRQDMVVGVGEFILAHARNAAARMAFGRPGLSWSMPEAAAA